MYPILPQLSVAWMWLDSVDPELVRSNVAIGATGATSNPIIVADLVATGRFDAQIERLVRQRLASGKLFPQVLRRGVPLFRGRVEIDPHRPQPRRHRQPRGSFHLRVKRNLGARPRGQPAFHLRREQVIDQPPGRRGIAVPPLMIASVLGMSSVPNSPAPWSG